ncbi:putative early transcription factor small subunit [Alphaentomopoxvirus acuprea]|uniref:Putative early transcription factor small subunit n=1 Tax=Alphaentomopoxvirus acuprea TaxID=62099 RepID=W6JKZ5_9POXV|nr:putative early transcription factor small subunit [Anomala cuprea entomopoxvirus]BAO49470.1 putative early transcription factor small subunit [Anomala cuprea entomopoxvirus]
MNKIILDDLRKYNVPANIPQILPHQLATLDYLYKTCVENNKSVLLFHKMGSGKTMISLLFAIIICNIKKILIVLPNSSILDMWKSNLFDAIKLLPMKEYLLENIEFTTRTKLNENILGVGQNITEIIENKIQNYNNYIMIIDEAHNFFGNITGKVLINIRKKTNIVYLLLTGSPITNTVTTLKDIVELLAKENFDFNKYIEQVGNKVFEKSINKSGIEFLNTHLSGLISYYDEERKDLPQVVFKGKKIFLYPLVLCPMSELHEKNYNEIADVTENEMFIKLLMNVSFVALGPKDNYIHFKELSDQQIFDNLYISNGRFYGSELIDLNISSKLKTFRDTIFKERNVGKRFIYFANSTIGSAIIRSVMRANGISEYGKEILNNYTCVNCITDKSCNDNECIPMKFIIITSKESNKGNNNYINNILSIFNEDINDEGHNILLLFGSKIISEAYTLKNVKDIWFLTVPETKSEFDQCIARAVRTFSYKDLNIKVTVRVCVATLSNTLISDISKTIEQYRYETLTVTDKSILLNEIELKLGRSSQDLSYDFRKQLYSELKFEKSKVADNIFKKLNVFITDKINNIVFECFIIEKIRRFCYTNNRFKYNDVINFLSKDIDYNNIYTDEILHNTNEAIENHLIIYNNVFGICYLDKYNDDIVTIPVILDYNEYLYSVRL